MLKKKEGGEYLVSADGKDIFIHLLLTLCFFPYASPKPSGNDRRLGSNANWAHPRCVTLAPKTDLSTALQVIPVSFPLLCRGEWQHTDALSEGFAVISREGGAYGCWEVSPNHQQNSACRKMLETKNPPTCPEQVFRAWQSCLFPRRLPDLAGSASQEVAKSGSESGIWWNSLKLSTRLFSSTFHLAITDPPALFLSVVAKTLGKCFSEDCGQVVDSCTSPGPGLRRTSLRCWFILLCLRYWNKTSALGQTGFSETYGNFTPQRHVSFCENQRKEANDSRSY